MPTAYDLIMLEYTDHRKLIKAKWNSYIIKMLKIIKNGALRMILIALVKSKILNKGDARIIVNGALRR